MNWLEIFWQWNVSSNCSCGDKWCPIVQWVSLSLGVKEMRRGEKRRRGRGRWDGLPKQHLTWHRLQAVNFLKVMVFVRVRARKHVCVSTCSNVHMPVSVYCNALYMSKHSCRSEPAGITVVSGALALGDGDDRIKTHHNAAVIFPWQHAHSTSRPRDISGANHGKEN